MVLVHPPFNEGFYASMAEPNLRARYESLIADIRNHVASEMDFIYWETAADCGLDDSIFLDFGHFSKEGAERFTAKLHEAVAGIRRG